MRRLKIFVPANRIPKPDESGGDRRFLALLEILARHHQVDFCAAQLLSAGETKQARRLLRRVGVRFLRPGWRSFSNALFLNWYDVGLFEFYPVAEELAETFRAKQPDAQIVVDSVDVHFARELAAAELGLIDREVPAITRRREVAVYRSADAVIAASQPDADTLEKEGGIGPIFVFPIVIPVRRRRKRARAREVIFVGGFNHPPNTDGLLWFVNEIWPRVRETVPDATLSIVGSNAPAEILALAQKPGVQVLGHVPDTAPYLDRAAVSIAPLRYGAGMKGKVVEALACGVPVVTTTVGIQGLSPRIGLDLEAVDEPEQFAGAVIRLLQDPESAERMGTAGQQLAAALCDRDRNARTVEEMLNLLVPSRSVGARHLKWLMSAPSRSWKILRRQAHV
jgi:glycosyltransferase involved in cell wall biosynthesis